MYTEQPSNPRIPAIDPARTTNNSATPMSPGGGLCSPTHDLCVPIYSGIYFYNSALVSLSRARGVRIGTAWGSFFLQRGRQMDFYVQYSTAPKPHVFIPQIMTYRVLKKRSILLKRLHDHITPLGQLWSLLRSCVPPGQACGQDCGNTPCRFYTTDDCVEGICEPDVGTVCAALGKNRH